MAPEVNERKYNFKANIYSLGLSLIELLTVQKPYRECEGALNIYVNKKKGNLPESFKLITDKGIREFIMLCLNKENKRPSAKELLEKNKWLNEKNNSENNTIIEIKGALRQKNFYLNNKYKSGGNFYIRNLSHKNSLKYNSKIFKTFNLKLKNSFNTNYNSENLINNNSIDFDKSSSFSFKNIYLFNKSATTSRTDNFFSNKLNIHNDEENIEQNINNNKIIDDYNSNISIFNSSNVSRDWSSNNNIINLNNINIICSNNNHNTNINIIKERNEKSLNYGKNRFNISQNKKKYFSPEQKKNNNHKIIPHLNIASIKSSKNTYNNYHKINSFRETIQNKICNNTSSIKSINIYYEENEYDYCNEFENNELFLNCNIIYSIKCNDNRTITCEYNYERDSIELIINNLKEIMNIDSNDIILLKNEFAKKIYGFMDKKKLQIFLQKYYIILNKFKMLGAISRKFDKIINEKNIKNDNQNNNTQVLDILEKIKDFQNKKNIINSLINNYKI